MPSIDRLERKLLNFLDSQNDRSWLTTKEVSVYVRKSKRICDLAVISCLDMASIDVSRSYRGKGYFKATLELFQRVCPFDAVYFESVNNPFLINHLTDLMRMSAAWRSEPQGKYTDVYNFFWIKDIGSQELSKISRDEKRFTTV